MSSREKARADRESTQQKNPHKLTLEQHVHSAAAIRRFADEDGQVSVLRRGSSNPFQKRSRDSIFCARRSWGEKLERGLFSQVEDRFQEALDAVFSTGEIDHKAITEYAIIWSIRDRLSVRSGAPTQLVGVKGSKLSKDQEEVLEKKQAAFVRADGSMPDRLANFIPAMRDFDFLAQTLAPLRWRAARTTGTRKFICPDAFSSFSLEKVSLLPVSPSVVLFPSETSENEPWTEADDAAVDNVNAFCLENARHLVFGHPRGFEAAVAGRQFEAID